MMKKNRWAIVMAVLAVMAILTECAAAPVVSDVSKESVELYVGKVLPLGISVEQTLTSLQKDGIETYRDSKVLGETLVYAIFRYDSSRILPVVKKSVLLTLYFKDDHLVRFDIKERLTGP
jgi:hypothetical protein